MSFFTFQDHNYLISESANGKQEIPTQAGQNPFGAEEKARIIDGVFVNINYSLDIYKTDYCQKHLDQIIEEELLQEHKCVIRNSLQKYIDQTFNDQGMHDKVQYDPFKAQKQNIEGSKDIFKFLEMLPEETTNKLEMPVIKSFLKKNPEIINVILEILKGIPENFHDDLIHLVCLGLQVFIQYSKNNLFKNQEFQLFIKNSLNNFYGQLEILCSELTSVRNSQNFQELATKIIYSTAVGASGCSKNKYYIKEHNRQNKKNSFSSMCKNKKKRIFKIAKRPRPFQDNEILMGLGKTEKKKNI